MPKANLGESLVIVLLVIEVIQRTQGGEWMNSATITLSPLNEQIFSKEKTSSYWVERRGAGIEHKASSSSSQQPSYRSSSSSSSSSSSGSSSISKSTNVLESILASTTPSSIHTSSSSSISPHKQTLTTSAVPVASTTVLDHTLTVVKASDRKGGVGDAEAKGPIISSLASVLAISYWQNQRKKCCLNRLCPCRQYPYFPNGNPAGGGMMPGMGPFPGAGGGPFGGGQGGFYPGMGGMPGMPGFPGQNRPGGFRPGGGGGGGGGGEEEEELEHGFQGPFEVHTARPPKRRRPSAIKPTVILRPVSAVAAGPGPGPHYPINGIKWSAVESSAPSSMSSSELSHEITGTSGLFSPAAQAVSDPLVRQTKVNSRPSGRANDTIQLDTSGFKGGGGSGKGKAKANPEACQEEVGDKQDHQAQEEVKEGTKKIVRAKRKSPHFPWMRVAFKDVLKDALQDGRISDTSQFAQARTSDSAFAWKETTQEEITVRDQVRSARGMKDLMDTISPTFRLKSPSSSHGPSKKAAKPPLEPLVESPPKPLLQPPVHLLLQRRKKRTPPSGSAAIVSPVMSMPTLTNGPSALASMGRINRRNSRKSTTNSDNSSGQGGNNGNSGGGTNSGSGSSASGGKKSRTKNSRMHETSTVTHSPRVHRSRNSHRERKG